MADDYFVLDGELFSASQHGVTTVTAHLIRFPGGHFSSLYEALYP